MTTARATPVGPVQRWLLRVMCSPACSTATAAYLGGVSAAEAVTGASYQGYVYQWTVLIHLAVGLVVVLPFVRCSPLRTRWPPAPTPTGAPPASATSSPGWPPSSSSAAWR